jgi:hypothetical protein
VEAYDICPTHKSDGNEYHGGTPPFVRVEKGNVGILSSVTGIAHKALLLCYPPPKSSMAYDAFKIRRSWWHVLFMLGIQRTDRIDRL